MHTTTTTAQSHSANASSPSASSGRFRKSMGLSALVLFGLAYMVPLAVFTTYGLVTHAVDCL